MLKNNTRRWFYCDSIILNRYFTEALKLVVLSLSFSNFYVSEYNLDYTKL